MFGIINVYVTRFSLSTVLWYYNPGQKPSDSLFELVSRVSSRSLIQCWSHVKYFSSNHVWSTLNGKRVFQRNVAGIVFTRSDDQIWTNNWYERRRILEDIARKCVLNSLLFFFLVLGFLKKYCEFSFRISALWKLKNIHQKSSSSANLLHSWSRDKYFEIINLKQQFFLSLVLRNNFNGNRTSIQNLGSMPVFKVISKRGICTAVWI